jgi:hypothetical protein
VIAHVAERGEGKGRVVLRIDACARPSERAVAAALRVAEAFQSEIESLVVEDRQLFDLVKYPFVREVSRSGREVRAINIEEIAREVQLAATSVLRQVEALAGRAQIPARRRVVRDDPIVALAHACAANGPWNVVALAEDLTAAHASLLRDVFETVSCATGVVVAGRRSRVDGGPVVAAVEEPDRLPPMLRAGERLAAASGTDVRLLLVSAEPEALTWMEGQARLMLAGAKGVRLERSELSRSHWQIADRLRHLQAGFVIAQFGGMVVPAACDLGALASSIESPMLLVR